MWDIISSIASLFSSSPESGGSDFFKDMNDMTMGMDSGMSGLSTMDKLGQFGKDQFNQAMNPYTQGFNDISNIYQKLKNGQGLLNSEGGPTALASMASLMSEKGMLGGDPTAQLPQITVMQPASSLGLPTAKFPSVNNSKSQPFVTSLARQAYGNYY